MKSKLTKEQEKRFDEVWDKEYNKVGWYNTIKQHLANELARQRKELAIEYDKKVQEYFAKVIKAIKEMKGGELE